MANDPSPDLMRSFQKTVRDVKMLFFRLIVNLGTSDVRMLEESS